MNQELSIITDSWEEVCSSVSTGTNHRIKTHLRIRDSNEMLFESTFDDTQHIFPDPERQAEEMSTASTSTPMQTSTTKQLADDLADLPIADAPMADPDVGLNAILGRAMSGARKSSSNVCDTVPDGKDFTMESYYERQDVTTSEGYRKWQKSTLEKLLVEKRVGTAHPRQDLSQNPKAGGVISGRSGARLQRSMDTGRQAAEALEAVSLGYTHGVTVLTR